MRHRPPHPLPAQVGEGHDAVQRPKAEQFQRDPHALPERHQRVLQEDIEAELLPEMQLLNLGLLGVRAGQDKVVEVRVMVEVVGVGVVGERVLVVPEEG
eukprot:evm.model.NODE_16776_length_8968_cov_27.233498.2